MNYGEGSMNILISIVIIVVIVLVGYRLIKLCSEFFYNNSQRIEKRQASIIEKRMHVYGENGAGTEYFITFEFENKERKEFKVKDNIYGLTAKGDSGILEYQGRRFNSFERD